MDGDLAVAASNPADESGLMAPVTKTLVLFVHHLLRRSRSNSLSFRAKCVCWRFITKKYGHNIEERRERCPGEPARLREGAWAQQHRERGRCRSASKRGAQTKP